MDTPRKDGYTVKKLLASMFMAGLLISGIGCGGTTTGGSSGGGDPKKKAIEDAKANVKKAEDALAAEKDDVKKKELQKALDDAKAALKKAEEAAKP